MLNYETGSWYCAKKNYWKYPFSKTEEFLATLIDVTIGSNWDEKKAGKPAPKVPRPYNTNEDSITGKPMAIERAKVVYKIKRTTRTPEELKALNKKFMEEQRKK